MARIIPIPIGPIFPGGPCRGIIHVIQKGDTLYQLGKRYHVSVGQLMFSNPFVDVYNLQIGDELCIPATIQPREAGAMERRQYQDLGGWENRNGRDGWEEGNGRSDWEDENGQENWQGTTEMDNWEGENSQENWQGTTEMDNWKDGTEMDNWKDGTDMEDWESRPGMNGWEGTSRNDWDD
ncbi:LysM domain-containing protein [Lachnospiraceae bacterium 45-W7]